MDFNTPNDIIINTEPEKAASFLSRVWGLHPLFVCTIGNTETAKIPGLSAAGAVPQITDFTPAADMELLHYGETRCMDGIPVTPEGIPTPALLTMSSLRLADIPMLVVNSGTRVSPHTPFVDVGGSPGEDIRSGNAVRDARGVFERSRVLGQMLSKQVPFLVVSESIAGGTTTALAVLNALDTSAGNNVSSSMPTNPKELKSRIVSEALDAAGIAPGALSNDPLAAVEAVGDPMMPANAGLVAGAAATIPVMMAGGTQMATVLALVSRLAPEVLGNVAIGTTRWIMKDDSSDMARLVATTADVPLMSAALDLGGSRYEGLKVYEQGYVKEGVGCGGAAIAAVTKSGGSIGRAAILAELERNYESLLALVD